MVSFCRIFLSLDPVSYTHLRAHETSLHLVCRLLLEKKFSGEILGPVSAPIFRLKKKYRIRLLIRGAKSLKLQNSLAAAIPNYKFQPGIKLSVDVDPINFN